MKSIALAFIITLDSRNYKRDIEFDYLLYTFSNSTQQDITDVGADTSYIRIYLSNLIKTLRL